MSEKKPLLSIGMIVKNEENKIEKCLKALKPLREAIDCELVIADTGSTDNTREIAEKYADILFDFEWIDDFSAARNAVMDRCSGEWYLSLDADEYLYPDIDELVSFLKNGISKKATSAYVTLHNYTDNDDINQYTVFYAHRLVKMSTKSRFYGRIHEVYDSKSLKACYYLKKTIFGHDGYIKNKILTDIEKGKRNIELIEKELQSDPDNLLRNFQAMESAYNDDILIKYTRKVVELVDKGVEKSDMLGPSAYRHAVKVAYIHKLKELDEWIKTACERYKDSLYIKVDVQYFLIMSAIEKKQYETIISSAKLYLDSINDINGENSEEDLKFGTLLAATKYHKEYIAISMSMAYAHLYKFEECKKILEQYQISDLSVGSVSQWLKVAYYVWQRIDLTDLFANIGREFYQNKELDKLSEKKKQIFEKNTKDEFMYLYIEKDKVVDDIVPDAPAYPLISALGDCDLGNSAKIMQLKDKTEIELISDRIENWLNIPNIVPIGMLINCAKFPVKFYNQSANNIQDLAGAVATILKENLVDICVRWIDKTEVSNCLMEKVWRYNLLLASMRVAKWKDEKSIEKYEELISRYIDYSQDFISWYYNPNLLNEEMIVVLPSMHRFAWLILQYENAKKQVNYKNSISWLRKALEIAPVMKNFISALFRYTEQEQKKLMYKEASPELLMLADKVKKILASFPDDNPIIEEIKQSDAYKQVKYLIEEPELKFNM